MPAIDYLEKMKRGSADYDQWYARPYIDDSMKGRSLYDKREGARKSGVQHPKEWNTFSDHQKMVPIDEGNTDYVIAVPQCESSM